jgi:starch-binding outer membrane protein, SusD/RagB family
MISFNQRTTMNHRARKRLLLGIAALTVSAGGIAGCKNFLTDASVPQGTLDAGTLANKAGVEGSLMAAYRQLDYTTGVGGGMSSAASNWIWGSITSDDAYKGSEATDAPALDAVELFQWASPGVEGELNDKWKAVYEGVVRSNAAIRLLKKIAADKPSEIAAADAKSIEGEALFLRAHYHFEAWRFWGNIPYYREGDTDFSKPNITKAQAATEILKDLDAAIALLPATPRNGDKARVTSWTAKAYKGRVQLYNGEFANALATLRDVKNAGPYALELSYDRVWTGFSAFENGKETILAYQASANDGEQNGNNANYGERLTFPHSGSPFGCCGFHQPSQNLVNFFATDATTGLPASQTNANWNASSANFTAAATTLVDPRLDFTVGRDGVPYKDWGPHSPDWIRAPSYGGVYSNKKNVHEKASGAQSSVGWVNTQLNSVNIHIFRYADLLLMLAEAEVEAGSLEAARTIVNDIRTRAAVKVQGPGTDAATIAVAITDPRVAAYAKYKIGTYTTPWTSQPAARNAVRDERRLELAMEGQRFFDLRRWGIAETVLNAYITTEKTRRLQLAGAATFAARYALFPIPSIQIQLSKGTGAGLTQNTGW